jgi:type I restriction enzyme, R subunit
MPAPEAAARQLIDRALTESGWAVLDIADTNLDASRGVAIREFPLTSGHGFADYVLFVDGRAAGVIEAKKAGTTLTGVELQAAKYSDGFPAAFPAHLRPLPFLYQSTGLETRFSSRLDPEPRSRRVFQFHQPVTLAAWLAAAPRVVPHIEGQPSPPESLPSTLRYRLRVMPPLVAKGLWPAQERAIRNLEASLADDRPRALIQMATGSGKTFTAISSIYRLIKFANARRVLFLVDRGNLGRQTMKEFQQYATPDDGRKFTELYNVQHLKSNRLDPVSRVCITTIQRLYSMLRGDADLDPTLEEGSQFDTGAGLITEPAPVSYNPAIPIETFDVIFTDECHRSIYNLWRQVLEYFDAHLIGLTATPSKQTFGFFNQNLVMEYNHDQAVADGVNVDFDVYRIRTQITEAGSTIDANFYVDKRDRLTRQVRWEKLDDEFTYEAGALDRSVVAMDQIRTVVRTFRDKLFTEIFPGRTHVPKTLIYAKDDSHADDIVQVIREEFCKGNEFCQKITYKTPGNAEDLIQSFRISYNPRIAVTVDMIATGTDIKPLEIVMFMRAVKSRNFFEQMKGRGVRVIDDTDFQGATPDARSKTHYVLVDCVGVCEQKMIDSQPLDRKKTIAFEKLLQAVAFGSTDPDVLSSLAGRLARLDRQLGAPDREALAQAAGGQTIPEIAAGLVSALDPDKQTEAARVAEGLAPEQTPTPEQVTKAAGQLLKAAAAPVATNPALRQKLIETQRRFEQTIDHVSQDIVLEASFSAAARQKAQGLVATFERYIETHKDEITALQVLYSRPYAQRLSFADIKTLAAAIKSPPCGTTPEALWRAYETLDQSKVRGAGARRLLTDIVSLVRYALHQEGELVPFAEKVKDRFTAWLAAQQNAGRMFTLDQREWLELIRDHIAANLAIEMDDFDTVPFNQRGGLGRVCQLFGDGLEAMLDELNGALTG